MSTRIHSSHENFYTTNRWRHLVLSHFVLLHFTDVTFFYKFKSRPSTNCQTYFPEVDWNQTNNISQVYQYREWEVKISYTLFATSPLQSPANRAHSPYQKQSKLTFRCAFLQIFFYIVLWHILLSGGFLITYEIILYLFYNVLFHIIICLGNILSEFTWF